MIGIKRKKQRKVSNQVSVREFETETETETVRHTERVKERGGWKKEKILMKCDNRRKEGEKWAMLVVDK